VGSLGYYDFTARVIHLPFRNIISISNRVALPAFCEVQEKIDLIKEWYLKMIGFSCLLMAPISVCLFILPGYFVPVIYGEKWLIAVPLIKIMAVFAFIMPFLYSWPVYVSTGRADLVLKFTAVRLVITAPLLFWAAKTSLSAVCFVEMISGCVFASVNFQIVKRLINIQREQIAKSIRAPLIGTAIFTVFLLTVKNIELHIHDTPSWISLLIILLPAIASYIVTIYLCSPETVSDLKKVIGISFGLGEKGLSEH
jgi:teichuronic acid exporter